MYLFPGNFPCTLENGQRGQCLDIRQCPYAYNLYVRERKMTKLCGYNGRIAVVCCPFSKRTSLRNDRTTPKKNSKSGEISAKSKLIFRIFVLMTTRFIHRLDKFIVSYNFVPECKEYNPKINFVFNGMRAASGEFPHMV